MITKINGVDWAPKTLKLNKKNTQKPNLFSQNQELSNYKQIQALKSNINFKGENEEISPLIKSIINVKESEIRIPNILDLDENINLTYNNTPKEAQYLNLAGLIITKNENGEQGAFKIENQYGNVIATGEYDKSKPLPTITYKQGKYMPEITVKDASLNGKSIKMLSGSILKGDGFTIKMPGKYEPIPGQKAKNIPFTGRVVVTTLNKEDRTLKAINKYIDSGLENEAIKGDYEEFTRENDPTVIIPAGGFGERFKNITRGIENKPSAKLPTSDDYRIIATTLNMASSAGILDGDNLDIKYISQRHQIPKDNEQIFHAGAYKTDGGAIAEGLTRDIIRNDKDAIILNADIFTNADITRTYHALKTLPDAGAVIPYYLVNPQRAKSFGLIGVKKDDNGNYQIEKFFEKPENTMPPVPNNFAPGQYTIASDKYQELQIARDPEHKTEVNADYLANPGFYFLSKEALKVLMAQGIIDPSQTGLGANVIPKIVEMANKGELVDKDGNQLKVYTVPLETKGGKKAVWDDIGTAEAYLRLIKDVASETQKYSTTSKNKYYGLPEFVLNDFKDNVDLTTGIVYDSKEARNALAKFKLKYNVEDIRGNIFIASNKK